MSQLALALSLVACTSIAVATTPTAASPSVLNLLAIDFARARDLPKGTRPPPPDVELKKLLGMQWSKVRAALGKTMDRGDHDWQCHAKECEIYLYGANESASDRSEMGSDGDLNWISVTTGGPFVLILGVSSNVIVSARWQGQR